MSACSQHFVGHILIINEKNGDTGRDENIVLEVTDARKDGTVDIAFDHGKDRVYVQFALADLMRELLFLRGTET